MVSLTALLDYKWVFLFYGAIILLVYLFRDKFEWHGIVGLYKTKVGLKLMESWGKKYQGLVHVLGYIGAGVGFLGMFLIVGFLIHGVWALIFQPDAPAVVSPVIPGVPIPGAAIQVPLITGWLALFIVIVIHEFSHGVVSRAHNVPVKSSGLLVFGFIGGAFVEPDEKKLAKQHESVHYSLFAAGPFSNIVTGILFLLIATFLFPAITDHMTTPTGVSLEKVTESSPAWNASLRPGMLITSVNNAPITDRDGLLEQLDSVKVGEAVIIGTKSGQYVVQTGQNPALPKDKKGYLGVFIKSQRDPKSTGAVFSATLAVTNWLKEFFYWLYVLSLGIGLANLLPLGPVDGGQMLRTASQGIAGKARGDWWWKKISMVTLLVIIVLLLVPIGKAIIG
jgi:membrane-associated protease RseP (regulator of RpoE activity)